MSDGHPPPQVTMAWEDYEALTAERDRLHAELEQLKYDFGLCQDSPSQANTIAEQARRIEQLEARAFAVSLEFVTEVIERNAALEQALRDYGGHEDGCPAPPPWTPQYDDPDMQCVCGFAATWAALAGPAKRG